jgi:hypothetical protein
MIIATAAVDGKTKDATERPTAAGEGRQGGWNVYRNWTEE